MFKRKFVLIGTYQKKKKIVLIGWFELMRSEERVRMMSKRLEK